MTPTLDRILLVDDDDDVRSVARLALETLGAFTVHACASGAEALAEGPGFAPQLVLLDGWMPDLDGLGTLAALRADPVLAGVPVVFLTADGAPGRADAYRAAGAVAVLVKPFEPFALPVQVREIWEALARS